jgi:pimeloyl-ACP methyl ester carboxylesterase
MDLNLSIDGRRIEAAWHGPPPDEAASLVLLHEGLGCVAMWRDFPHALAERTRYGVLVYSRAGYGKSDPVALPRPLSYMQDEACVVEAVLDQAAIRKAILVGHSDGASIAAIYAGGRQDFRVRGLVLIAPHFFVEDVALGAITAARTAYESGDLKERLAKFHGDNVDVAFWGWNRAWLDPGFRSWRIDDHVAEIRVPMLIIQGEDDPYGTPAQIALARNEAYCPVEAVMLPGCGHSPHLDRPDQTLDVIAGFVRHLLEAHEGARPIG